ncbi:toxin co-regulated pilus biosynthesis Q family protein [Chromobacterium amazonense]|uniref:toxin co-regulated pilus biosynthesis Q family protein n=1 Tax=Chromobacterium amazonense TaxID=1382803 RepID=UPI003F79CE37
MQIKNVLLCASAWVVISSQAVAMPNGGNSQMGGPAGEMKIAPCSALDCVKSSRDDSAARPASEPVKMVAASMLNHSTTGVITINPDGGMPKFENVDKSATKPLMQKNLNLQEKKTDAQREMTTLPVKPLSVMSWKIRSGVDLKTQLDEWASLAGWSVIWDSEYSYEMENQATFSGNFIEVVSELFISLRTMSPRLYPVLYRGNRVLLVKGQPS